MIEKDGPFFIVQCDTCSNYHEGSESGFQEVIDEVKKLGWKIIKREGEWAHQCGSCQLDPNEYQDET